MSRRLPSLDGLRAVSIFFVLNSHWTATENFPAWLDWPLPDGSAGVHVFFVLSGFLINRLLLDEQDRTGGVSLRRFYLRRAVRILPVLWAYLLFVAVLWRAGVVSLEPANLLAPLTFTNGFPFWSGRVAWVTAHTWSLAVEEQFYLVWPAVFVVTAAVVPRRLRLVSLLVGLSVLLAAGPAARAWMFVRPRRIGLIYSAVGNADLIGWGCTLALLMSLIPERIDRLARWRPAFGRAIAVVIFLRAPWYVERMFGMTYRWSAWSLQAAAVAYLIASLTRVRSGWSYRLLNSAPFVLVGVLSYSLYIWQEFFLALKSHGHADHAWQRWPVNAVCLAVAASISFWCIERPTRLLRHGINRPGRKKTGPAPADRPMNARMLLSPANSFRHKSGLAVGLSWVAGYTNVISLIVCGQTVSHQTGNTTRLGEILGNAAAVADAAPLREATDFLLVLGLFVCGAIFGGLLTDSARRNGRYLMPVFVETVLLCLMTVFLYETTDPMLHPRAIISTAAFAMGLQNATITRISGAVVRTTHLTGVVTDIGLELAFVLSPNFSRSPDQLSSLKRLTLLGGIFGSFLIGATAGAVLQKRFGPPAMLLPVGFLATLLVFELIKQRRIARGQPGASISTRTEPLGRDAS